MSYKGKNSRTNATVKDGVVDLRARVHGDLNDGTSLTVGEVEAKGGFDGIGVRGEAGGYVLKCSDFKSKTAVKAFGAAVKANAGIDFKALTEKDKIIGYELKAKATLVECKAGPIFLHLGAGVTNAAKVEDGTIDAKLAGNGIKVGKRIGVSVYDNEFSVETLSLVGKGWLWGQFDQ